LHDWTMQDWTLTDELAVIAGQLTNNVASEGMVSKELS